VLLDVDADRYFCLRKTINDAFLALAAGTEELEQRKRLGALIERGLLVETNSLQPFQPCASNEAPRRDFVPETAARRGIVPILRALASELRASWLLRTHPFHQVVSVAGARGSKRSVAPANGDRAITSIAAAADAISFFTRAHNRCLVRALAVHAACRALGVGPKLVFGVIAHPFAAHCWVQLGDAVLVGGFEHARLYTPILVIE
jgi:hypothetical protein